VYGVEEKNGGRKNRSASLSRGKHQLEAHSLSGAQAPFTGRLKMRERKMRYGQKCKGGKCRSGKCGSR